MTEPLVLPRTLFMSEGAGRQGGGPEIVGIVVCVYP